MISIFQAGGPVMYPLLFCSVITLAIIIDRTLFWLRLRNGRRLELIAKLCRSSQSLSNPADLIEIKQDVVGCVLLAGIENDHSMAGWEMQLAAKRELDRMTQYQGILKIMVSLAPLLGIFGTVLGIIESFSLLGDHSLVDPIAASSGLAEALVTTAFGLAIAMLSLIAFAIFQSRAEKLHYEMEVRCTELERAIKLTAQET